MTLECLCHGLMFPFNDAVERVDWLAFVIFVSNDPLRVVLEDQTIYCDAVMANKKLCIAYGGRGCLT